MKKTFKRNVALILAGAIVITNPIVGTSDITRKNNSTVTCYAAVKYDSFSSIVKAVTWGAGFLKDAKNLFHNKSKTNHVFNVTRVSRYYYGECKQDIGKTVNEIVKDNVLKEVNLGLNKKSSDSEVKKVVTAYIIGCLDEYNYIMASGILDDVINSNKNNSYDFTYSLAYFSDHKKYCQNNTPYEYMASHTTWNELAYRSAGGTGYLVDQDFKNLEVIVEKAIKFLY